MFASDLQSVVNPPGIADLADDSYLVCGLRAGHVSPECSRGRSKAYCAAEGAAGSHHDMSERASLTEGQHRHLSSSLGLIEEELLLLSRAPESEGSSGVLSVDLADLSAEEEQLLRETVQGFKHDLATLAERFQLEPRARSRRLTVSAVLSAAWVRLHDCMSDRIKSYGRLDPVLRERLDPLLRGMIARLERLRSAMLSDTTGA